MATVDHTGHRKADERQGACGEIWQHKTDDRGKPDNIFTARLFAKNTLKIILPTEARRPSVAKNLSNRHHSLFKAVAPKYHPVGLLPQTQQSTPHSTSKDLSELLISRIWCSQLGLKCKPSGTQG